SGGSISASGAYTAGPTGNVNDTVQVADSQGNQMNAVVTVTAGLSISPASATVAPGGTKSFTASGGSGTGFSFSLSGNPPGGSVSTAGAYTAGATANVTDTVRVVDSLGNAASAAVTVTSNPAVAVSPSSANLAPRGTRGFTASGGSGTGFT